MKTALQIAKTLTLSGQTVATAESCTGGLISHTLTNIPGSSNFYKGGVVAYANDIKVRLIGIPNGLVQKYGAVSKEVARAMAKGIRNKAKTDFSIAVTGIAGPTGGTKTKPVGLVFVAVSTLRQTSVKRFIFKGTRLQIKTQTAAAALRLLLKLIR